MRETDGGIGDGEVGIHFHIDGEDLVADTGKGIGANKAGRVGIDVEFVGGSNLGFRGVEKAIEGGFEFCLVGVARVGAENRVLKAGVPEGHIFGEDDGEAEGLLESGDIHHGGGPIHADRVLAVVELPRVTGGAGEADGFPGLAGGGIEEVLLVGEANGQIAGVQVWICRAREEPEATKILGFNEGITSSQGEAWLFEGHEPAIGDQAGSLGGVVELDALCVRPALVELDEFAGLLVFGEFHRESRGMGDVIEGPASDGTDDEEGNQKFFEHSISRNSK